MQELDDDPEAAGAKGGTVVVAQAADPIEAAIWVDALRDAGIEAASFERGGVGPAFGGAAISAGASYPVLVRRRDLGSARSVIAEFAGAAALAPYRDPRSADAAQRRILVGVGAFFALVIAAALAARLLA